MSEVQTAVSGLSLPSTIRVEYGGLYQQQQQSFRDLAMVFAAALLLTMLLITFLFRRFYWGLAAVATILLVASAGLLGLRSEEHTSELQSLMRISYAVFCLK